MGGNADNWYRVALFAFGAVLISLIAVLSGPKATHKVLTRDLGQTHTTDEVTRVPAGVAG